MTVAIIIHIVSNLELSSFPPRLSGRRCKQRKTEVPRMGMAFVRLPSKKGSSCDPKPLPCKRAPAPAPETI